ncbi:MAG: lysozyme [Burkholderiaceae bacterium]|nr:lysozyme [Burkholderiaceae bacterium]
MNPPMQYSGTGLALTKIAEGCRLLAYQDGGGVWTNGYGNTHGVVPGSTITQEQAEADLLANIQNSVNDVNRLVTVPLTQGEFDALVDFDYNLGRGNLASSTLLKDLNAGNYAAAAEQFEAWDKCGGHVVAGLLRRRQAEEAEFSAT